MIVTDKLSGHTVAGLVQSRRARLTGTIVNIYRAKDAGLDDEGGAWVTVCEYHAQLSNHGTLETARYFAPYPDNWCSDCAAFTWEPDEQIWLPGGGSYTTESPRGSRREVY